MIVKARKVNLYSGRKHTIRQLLKQITYTLLYIKFQNNFLTFINNYYFDKNETSHIFMIKQ